MSRLVLALVSALAGLAVVLVFRFTADLPALRTTRKRMQAHFLEFRLFFDEPALIWRAQVELLRDNLRLLRLLSVPLAVLVAPMIWVMAQLDATYGFRAFAPGEVGIVTAQFDREHERAKLVGSDGVTVEAEVAADRQTSWRIRAMREGEGTLRLTSGGQTIDKDIVSGRGLRLLSQRRSRSLVDSVMHPFEGRLDAGELDWIAVDYPARHESISWVVWFLLISSASAWLSARWLRVPF